MMRVFAFGALVLAVAACDPVVPDSGAGFDSYTGYAAQRNAQLQGTTETTNVLPPAAGATTQTAQTQSQTQASAGQQAAQAQPAKPIVGTNNVGISDTQDFSAVKSRETIESDRERLAAQRQQYKVIAPTALPPRPGSTGPNIVNFALSTTNRVGQSIYRRASLFAESRYNRNCGKYASPDLAQEAFLRAGGPQKDRMGLDPDGDGFACSWDPQPFRSARQ